MANVNISKVYLLNAPLENDYKHTLYFNSRSGQEEYFKSRIVRSYDDFSYQRKDNIIRVPDHFDLLQNVNYVMYQNTAYSNKWFYAFVTDVVYVDDGRTDIHIETDYIQTWLFDYTVKPSFVEREHVDNDTVGLHTLPEGLETGEYITNKHITTNLFGECAPVMAVTEIPPKSEDDKEIAVFKKHNGLYQGCTFISGAFANVVGGGSTYVSLESVIQDYVNGKSDAINSIFIAPRYLIQGNTITRIGFGGKSVSFLLIDETDKPYKKNLVGNPKPTTIDGYTPVNKKLLTYPYCYLNLDNNSGNCGQYRYEYFNGDTYSFSADMALVPGISTKIYPDNYQNIDSNFHHAMSVGKLPICSWSTDVYTNWITQNSVNLGVSVGGAVGQMVAGTVMMAGGLTTTAATGGVGATVGIGMMASGLQSIASTMGQIHQHEMIPPTLEGNLNTGDVNFGLNLHNPMFYEMSIKREYAMIIDKFFTMFGYKVNMVKTPNTHHRSRYWYTKTIDVNIDGAIPNKDMQVIKNCYNNGITFWRNANEIQNYDLSNEIKNIV